MSFSLLFFVYIALIHPGVDLKEVPDEARVEVSATASSGAIETLDVSKIEKMWVPNEKVIAYGQGIFKTNCSACHGEKGMGDGPAGKSLVPPPRNLVEGKWKQGGTSQELFKTLQTGIPGSSMVAFKSLPAKDRWALVQFIRSITKNKSADDAKKLDTFGPTGE
ncbi:MAG: cytochrome c [Bdellovibrionales bacterium]|nr:cytochrome c [Bdellovibrionales bacterium]